MRSPNIPIVKPAKHSRRHQVAGYLSAGMALLGLGCHAQPGAAVTPVRHAAGVPAARQAKAGLPPVIEVPLYTFGKYGDGRMYVVAEIDGQEGLLLVDTGAEGLVLNTSEVKTPSMGSLAGGATGAAVGSNQVPTQVYMVHRLHWGGGTFTNDIAYGADLRADEAALRQSPVFDSLHKPFLGLMGIRELSPYLTIFDPLAHKLTLYLLDSAGTPLAGPPAFGPSVATLPLPGGGLSGTVAGQPLTLGLDTGAGAYIMLTSETARTLAAHITVQDSSATAITGDISGSKVVHVGIGRLHQLVLGPIVQDSVPVVIGVTQSNLYGAKMVAKHKIGLNVRTGTLYIWY